MRPRSYSGRSASPVLLSSHDAGLPPPASLRTPVMSPEGGMTPGRDDRMNRRGFLSITGIASVATILGVAPVGRLVYAAALTRAQRDKLTPDDIIALMKKGNERFRLGQESPHDYLAQQKGSAKGQYPPAVILSCMDPLAPARPTRSLGV